MRGRRRHRGGAKATTNIHHWVVTNLVSACRAKGVTTAAEKCQTVQRVINDVVRIYLTSGPFGKRTEEKDRETNKIKIVTKRYNKTREIK